MSEGWSQGRFDDRDVTGRDGGGSGVFHTLFYLVNFFIPKNCLRSLIKTSNIIRLTKPGQCGE